MKKNIKRFLSMALALIMVIGFLPVGHARAEETTDTKHTYRWDYVEGEGLVSNTSAGYTKNELKVSSGQDASKKGTLTGYWASMATAAVLKSDAQWYVEWKSTGAWNGGVFLSDVGGTSGQNYVYYNSANIFCIGRNSGGFQNMGFKTSEEATAIDMTVEHTFRLENRINEDDSNDVWLVVDGKDHFQMNSRLYVASTLQDTVNDWISGATLTFQCIGNISGMSLTYLEICEGVNPHTHAYSPWTVSSDGTKLERSCSCGVSESNDYYGYRWEMNTDGNALVSVEDTVNDLNDLTKVGNGAIVDRQLGSYAGSMATAVTLKHDVEWVIEFKSSGLGSGMMLTGQGAYLYKHSNVNYNLLSFGIKNNGFENYSVDVSGIDHTDGAMHVYRIENRIDANGESMAYLVVDGVEVGAMNHYRIGTGASNSTSNALYQTDFTFTTVGGGAVLPAKMNLEYLQIWPNGVPHQHTYVANAAAGADCQTVGVTTYTCACGDSYTEANTLSGDHVYGDWAEVGSNLVRECTLCDASDSEVYTGYYWKMSEDGTTLENVVDGIFAANELTKTSGEIADGTLKMYKGSFAAPLVLEHDKEWAIEWVSSGAWNTANTGYGGVFLADGITNYLYYNVNNVFAIGRHEGTYKHYGFMTSDTATAIDMTAKHSFRLENRVNDDGTNEVWLVLDGKDFFEMDSKLYHGSNMQPGSDDWLNGHDLTFTTIGNSQLAAVNDMKLEYLKVWLNTPAEEAVHNHNPILTSSTPGADCQSYGVDTYSCSCGDSYTEANTLTGDHVYGGWSLTEDGASLTRSCVYGDHTETEAYVGYWWKMNENEDALENVVDGIFAANELTKTAGSIEGGVLTTYKGSFAQSMLLDSSREWVIEWKSSGHFNTASRSYGSMFLSAATSHGGYVYYNVNRILSIGHNVNGSYHNFGFDMDDYPSVDMTAEHVFRLENRVNADGSNEIWLVLDGVDFFNMGSQWHVGSDVQTAENTWLNGADITITQIGNELCGTGGMDLEYLKVWLNTPAVEEEPECDHSNMGEWELTYTETDVSVLQRTCLDCGEYTEKPDYFTALYDEDDKLNVTVYETLTDALADTGDNMIRMQKDTVFDGDLELKDYKFLDMNGYTLTVTGTMYINEFANIEDSTQGLGLLAVDKDKLIIMGGNNDWLPIYNGSTGYVFVQLGYQENQRMTVNSADGKTVKYYFEAKMPEYVHDYLSSADSNVTLHIEMSWTKSNEPGIAQLNCNQEMLASYYNGYDAENDKYTYAFVLTVTNADLVDAGSLSFRPYFKSVCTEDLDIHFVEEE